jgi:hypothetical protein
MVLAALQKQQAAEKTSPGIHSSCPFLMHNARIAEYGQKFLENSVVAREALFDNFSGV